MYKNVTFTLKFIGLFMLLIACSFTRYYSEDPFYSYNGEWDSIRFPLIKPYEVIDIGLGNGWGMSLYPSPSIKGIQGYIGIEDIEKISVIDGIIMVYTRHKPYIDVTVGEKAVYWFVIIPAKKIEVGFDNEDDFLQYLNGENINEPTWEDPDSIFQRFQSTGCLKWIPDCNLQ